MTAEEFRSARERLGVSIEQLAADLQLPVSKVRAWEAGTADIPRQYAGRMVYDAAVVEQTAALEASGLPECDWARERDDEPFPEGSGDRIAWVEQENAHAAACAVCQARERWMDENLPPLPPFPHSGPAHALIRVDDVVQRFPAWARPAVWGALAGFSFTAIRMIGELSRSGDTVEAALVLAGAAGAGALAGIAYTVARFIFRPLGRPGDYLAGITCVFVYAVFLALMFGGTMIRDTEGQVILVGLSLLFGSLIGHHWFRSPRPPAPTS